MAWPSSIAMSFFCDSYEDFCRIPNFPFILIVVLGCAQYFLLGCLLGLAKNAIWEKQ